MQQGRGWSSTGSEVGHRKSPDGCGAVGGKHHRSSFPWRNVSQAVETSAASRNRLYRSQEPKTEHLPTGGSGDRRSWDQVPGDRHLPANSWATHPRPEVAWGGSCTGADLDAHARAVSRQGTGHHRRRDSGDLPGREWAQKVRTIPATSSATGSWPEGGWSGLSTGGTLGAGLLCAGLARGGKQAILACFGLATKARTLHLRSGCTG